MFLTALGQKRRLDRGLTTSGLFRLADMLRVRRHVANVPLSDTAGLAYMKRGRQLRRPYFTRPS
jgi:hypothetical protein